MIHLPTQKRTVDGQSYTFQCLQGDGRTDEIEVYVAILGTQTYPRFRYIRSIGSSWTLIGKGTRESARVRDTLEEIWNGATHA